jgi:hypothetical protein
MQLSLDKSGQIVLFPFPPTGNGNNQPYPLLLIKYELKLPSEVTPGLLVIQIQIHARAFLTLNTLAIGRVKWLW